MADIKSIDPKTAAVARAIYQALNDADPGACMGEFSLDHAVIIDGDFNLYAVASLLLINLHNLDAQACSPTG